MLKEQNSLKQENCPKVDWFWKLIPLLIDHSLTFVDNRGADTNRALLDTTKLCLEIVVWTLVKLPLSRNKTYFICFFFFFSTTLILLKTNFKFIPNSVPYVNIERKIWIEIVFRKMYVEPKKPSKLHSASQISSLVIICLSYVPLHMNFNALYYKFHGVQAHDTLLIIVNQHFAFSGLFYRYTDKTVHDGKNA